MPAPDSEDKSVAGAAFLAAAAFAIALVLAIFFAWHPGAEVPQPGGPASKAVAPRAEVTPDTRGDTGSLNQPAPPGTTGAGPAQSQR